MNTQDRVKVVNAVLTLLELDKGANIIKPSDVKKCVKLWPIVIFDQKKADQFQEFLMACGINCDGYTDNDSGEFSEVFYVELK